MSDTEALIDELGYLAECKESEDPEAECAEREIIAALRKLEDLRACVRTAIASGDWKVNGANDPEALLR